MQQQVTSNIFNQYSTLATSSEKGKGIKRIGMYTFAFKPDGKGVKIEKNIVGRIEKVWDIESPLIGTVDTATINYWYVLEKMEQNASAEADAYLTNLAEKYPPQSK